LLPLSQLLSANLQPQVMEHLLEEVGVVEVILVVEEEVAAVAVEAEIQTKAIPLLIKPSSKELLRS